MALSGCFVACAYSGSTSRQTALSSLLGRPVWTQVLAAGGAVSAAAPDVDPQGFRGDPVFHFRAVTDGYLVIDPAPNANDASQIKIVAPAGEWVTVYVKKGDKALFVGA